MLVWTSFCSHRSVTPEPQDSNTGGLFPFTLSLRAAQSAALCTLTHVTVVVHRCCPVKFGHIKHIYVRSHTDEGTCHVDVISIVSERADERYRVQE